MSLFDIFLMINLPSLKLKHFFSGLHTDISKRSIRPCFMFRIEEIPGLWVQVV